MNSEVLSALVGRVCSVEMSGKCNIVKVMEIRGDWLVVEDNDNTAYINLSRIDEIQEVVEKKSVRRTLLNNVGARG